MRNSQQQTPLEQLSAEKNRVRKLLKEQEVTINEHVTYVQANAGTLLLSLISSMLFSPSAKKGEQNNEEGNVADDTGENTKAIPSEPLSFADFIPMAKLMLPVAWEIAKPILISWSIKKAGALTARLFARKNA